ncbi:unnamed protein product [Rotaria socialis]|uniref:Uncharacterized protein n=3 Tax=Rotaria socialis TaxID=392032 RepID=A0A818KT98_9BILA|nr:unnamed protein product [Rotaria socialis]CAF4750208.1 unnamed protein product [Rotaria socialis]
MPRHAFLQSKTTLTTCKKNSNQSERIHDKENEKNDNDQMRKYLTNKRDNVVIFQQHGQRWSKNQSTSDKRSQRRLSSKMGTTFAGSRSAVSESPSTVPNGTRSSLLNSLSPPSRDKTAGHVPLSTTILLNDSRSPPRIKILELRAEIESKPTLIDETSSSVLKYKTPQFKSHVTFQMPPIDENQNWKVGWIQACTHMEFFNTYGDHGYTSWEFPEMVTREKPLINDSDGRNYPWYGSSHQVVTINGPILSTSKYTVTMRDFFHPWYVSIMRRFKNKNKNKNHTI